MHVFTHGPHGLEYVCKVRFWLGETILDLEAVLEMAEVVLQRMWRPPMKVILNVRVRTGNLVYSVVPDTGSVFCKIFEGLF